MISRLKVFSNSLSSFPSNSYSIASRVTRLESVISFARYVRVVRRLQLRCVSSEGSLVRALGGLLS